MSKVLKIAPHLAKKSVAELVDAAVMVAAQLSELNQILKLQGVSCEMVNYDSGRITVEYFRITTEALYRSDMS